MNVLSQTVALGPLVLSIGQLLLVFALVVALIAGALAGLRRRIPVSGNLFALVLVSLAGARLLFVISYWSSFDGLLATLDLRDGGFSPLGGVIAGGGYAAWRLWRTPLQRGPLATALVAGAIAWGMTAGPLLVIGQHARGVPEVALTTMEGEQTDLPRLIESREQPLVVNLWATWCPACRHEKAVFQQVQQEEEGVTFAFVNQGEDPGQIDDYLAEHAPELENVLLDRHQRLSDATGTRGLPATFFFDEQGQLVDSHTGQVSSASLERGLERLR
ncbi:MAG: redoxin family protein [Halorhodospira sp.]